MGDKQCAAGVENANQNAILCSHCYKAVDECACEDPCLTKYECKSCGASYSHPSLHQNQIFERNWSPPTVCDECGSDHISPGEWNLLTPSEHRCGICGRRDGQRLIQSCDCVDCTTKDLFHSSCMVAAGTSPSGQKLYNYVACADLGKQPATESDTENSCEGPEPQLHFWEEDEIKSWAQVTMRMTRSAGNKDEYHYLLRQRWREAWPHLAIATRSPLKAIIEEECGLSL